MRTDGFSLLEVSMATLLMALLISSTLAIVSPTAGAFHALPETADLQQRLRVAVETVRADLQAAGSGALVGGQRGPLARGFPPIVPYRIGARGSDTAVGVHYRPDVVSTVSIPLSSAQVVLREIALPGASLLAVTPAASCPPPSATTWCGFRVGTQALVYDGRGAWDAVTIAGVGGDTLSISNRGGLGHKYDPGAVVAEVRVRSYALRADAGGAPQLLSYDGFAAEFPVVENVVALGFEYYGEVRPPERLEATSLDEPTGPWTTYGPRPPQLGVDDEGDSWLPGENCVFRVSGGRHEPRLSTLGAATSLARLDAAVLTDGPWCPEPGRADAFDADLLRIRRVRVRLRVQATMTASRGPVSTLFLRAGQTTSPYRFVPDQQVEFDVTPPNLSSAR